MKRPWVIGLSVVIVLLALGLYLTRGSDTPAGQPPLVDLKAASVPELQTEFNLESANSRVILLLSPTCPVCLQGASAVESMLQHYPHTRVTVFVIWEPILPTDWRKPGTSVLRRLSDTRVRQFWDSNHSVATILKNTGEAGKLHLNCCRHRGVLWDVTAAYPPGLVWNDIPPVPVFFNGTVVQSVNQLTNVVIRTR